MASLAPLSSICSLKISSSFHHPTTMYMLCSAKMLALSLHAFYILIFEAPQGLQDQPPSHLCLVFRWAWYAFGP